MYFRYGGSDWESSDAAGNGDGPRPLRLSDGQGNGAGTRHPEARHRAPQLPAIELRGVRINAITEATCVSHVLSELEAGRGGMVVTPNLDHLHRSLHDVGFAALLSEADLVVADGMPLVWAARLQGTPLPERVAGSNLILSLSRAAAERGKKVFLLGGAPGTAEGAARVLREKNPSLNVVGTLCPPVGFESDPAALAEIIEAVSTARPDIVFVALGSPKQERLIVRLRPLLPGAWWLGVGISFSFLCGDVRRAPLWMQKVGLEWVHRLVQEPRRLFRRYVVVGIPFAAGLLGRALLRRHLYGHPVSPRMAASASGNGHLPEDANGDGDGNGHLATPVADAPAPIPVAERLASFATPPAPQPTAGLVDGAAGGVCTGRTLSRLRALVLLGGSVRPTALGLATARSVLDLPLDENGSVFNGWLDQSVELARSIGLEKLPVRVMVNQKSPEPFSAEPRHYGNFRVERDLSEYRGTGGVLHDLATEYGDEDLILVANAAQVLLDPLPAIAAALEETGGDVTVVSHADGTPSGIMLVTCKTLRLIAETGYVDMKEQALPEIATRFDVRVLDRRRPTGLPIRTLEDYVQAVRYHHRRKAGKKGAIDPLAEDWNPVFGLVEPGATVDPTARVHDSVVLAGGVVEAGAVLVRSVVCPGGVLKSGKIAVEQFVSPPRDTSPRGFEVRPAAIAVGAGANGTGANGTGANGAGAAPPPLPAKAVAVDMKS